MCQTVLSLPAYHWRTPYNTKKNKYIAIYGLANRYKLVSVLLLLMREAAVVGFVFLSAALSNSLRRVSHDKGTCYSQAPRRPAADRTGSSPQTSLRCLSPYRSLDSRTKGHKIRSRWGYWFYVRVETKCHGFCELWDHYAMQCNIRHNHVTTYQFWGNIFR